MKNFGYDEYYTLESMSTDGFQKVNSLSYEDDIMLKPSENWLREHKEKVFVAEYRTGAGYYDYQCVPNRYGSETSRRTSSSTATLTACATRTSLSRTSSISTRS